MCELDPLDLVETIREGLLVPDPDLTVRLAHRSFTTHSQSPQRIPLSKGGPAMNRKAKLPFDPKVFLSKVNGGRAISDYRKDQIVFRQGDPSDAVFYIQSGKVKKTVVSEQGKEAVVAFWEPAISLARAAWPASRCVCRRSRPDEMRDRANIEGQTSLA